MPKYQGMSMDELHGALATAREARALAAADDRAGLLLQDLRVHEIELEVQNLELRQAHAALAESNARYADLYDFAPICYCTFDEHGLLQDINLTGAAMLGRQREALLGLPFVAVARMERPAPFFAHLERCFAGTERVVSEIEIRAGDGARSMEMVSTPARGANGEVVGCRTAMIDVTERRHALEVLHLFGDLALRVGGIDGVGFPIDELARTLAPAIADVSLICLFGTDGAPDRVAAHGARGAEDAMRHLEGTFPRLPGVEQLVARVTESQLALLVPAPGATSPVTDAEASALQALGVRSLILVPLLARAGVSGVLALATTSAERSFGAAELALGTEIGRRSARFIGAAQLYGDALRATQARDEVMALVSHDLGGTAAAIAMAASALLDGEQRKEPGAAGRGQVELIRRSAESIQHMVRDLLDTTLIEMGHLRISVAPVAAADLAHDAEEVVRPAAQHAGVAMEIDVAQGLEVVADRHRVRQVLVNLAHNALKASERGGVVRLSVTPQGDDRALFALSDDGPGVAPADRDRIFEAFWRGEQSRSTGLGLAIAKRIMDVHGERIWTENAPSGGATFLFSLPRTRSASR
jgi:PAS domain S-box-containing protein